MRAPVDDQPPAPFAGRRKGHAEGSNRPVGSRVLGINLGGVERGVVLRPPGIGLVVEDQAPSTIDLSEPHGIQPREPVGEVAGGKRRLAESERDIGLEARRRRANQLDDVALGRSEQASVVFVLDVDGLMEEDGDPRPIGQYDRCFVPFGESIAPSDRGWRTRVCKGDVTLNTVGRTSVLRKRITGSRENVQERPLQSYA